MGGGTPPNPTLNKTRPKKITVVDYVGGGGGGGVPPPYRSRNVVDYVGGGPPPHRLRSLWTVPYALWNKF